MNISFKGNIRSCLASLLMLKFQFIIWEKKKKQKEEETKKINQKTSSWIIAVTISFKLTPGQTASNMYMRCLVLLAGFTKHVRRAHVYYEADFAPTHPRWLIIGSRVFDGLLIWYTVAHVTKHVENLVNKHVWSCFVTKHLMFDWIFSLNTLQHIDHVCCILDIHTTEKLATWK